MRKSVGGFRPHPAPQLLGIDHVHVFRSTRPEDIVIWSLLRLVAIVHVVVPKPLRTFGPDALKPVIKRDLPNRRGNLRLCGWAASC
ncbi:hypothetical protein [Sinorhizobium meliloti]|uniref:hypothetical protein n=1 Tax=Rhizobium meliloti TaxID=382 RepID=UPI0013E2EC98|nr:hypothetical protein [Sinorhizobium meliloti]